MKKRILLILHLPPPVHGAAIVGKNIRNSIAINNHFDADYINLSTSSDMAEVDGVNIKKLVKLAVIQGQVLKALFSKQYDLCYITLSSAGAGFYKDFMVVLLLKVLRKKIIYHFHNKGIHENSRKRLNDLVYRFVFRNTQSILLSERLYGDLKKYVSRRDVYFCPNGMPVSRSDAQQSFDFQTNTKKKCRLLYLSNMVVEKGVLVLLNACRQLKENGHNFECHFVGAWTDIEASYFENLINNYNLKSIVFAHGPQYNDAKQEFFQNANIFVLPTYYHNECFPLVLLEAMSYGLPIISTEEGGIPDIILDNETGFIVEKNSVTDLTSKLEVLINNPGMREDFGKAGKKRFLDLFTIEKFEQNMVDIVESAICNSKKEV